MSDNNMSENDVVENETPENFWDGLEEEAALTLEQQGLNPDQVITLSTPTGQMVTIPVEGVTSIRDLLTNQQLSISPAAQFLVDGTYVSIEHEVAPGGHVVVSVPLKAG